MKINFKQLAVLAIILGGVWQIEGQERWGLSFSPSLNFPLSKVQEEPLRLGNGFEIAADYRLSERLQPYAGFIWNRFDTDEEFDEPDIRYVQKGFILGSRYYFALKKEQSKFFYLRAGVVLMDLRTRSEGEVFEIDTDFNLGLQLGAGVNAAISQQWQLRPEIRFLAINHEVNSEFSRLTLDFRHLSVGMGLRYNLP